MQGQKAMSRREGAKRPKRSDQKGHSEHIHFAWCKLRGESQRHCAACPEQRRGGYASHTKAGKAGFFLIEELGIVILCAPPAPREALQARWMFRSGAIPVFLTVEGSLSASFSMGAHSCQRHVDAVEPSSALRAVEHLAAFSRR